jgi:ribosome-binding factor A
MEFNRHDRVRSLLTELIASFIQEEASPNPLITVTNVTTSPDYRKVTAFITTIPDGGEEHALIFLKRKAKYLRTHIKKKSNLKIIPHIDFQIDYGERHRQHIDEIAKEIDVDKNT